jgi:hypothetical protein
VKVLIAGLAKTGTTGLLFLIATSFGNKPKLLFEPKVCPPDLAENGDVVAKVIIDASLKADSFAHFDRKVTLVRDPRDRLISVLLYSQFHGNYLADDSRVLAVRECLERKESSPSTVSIREILQTVGTVTGNPDNVPDHRMGVAHSMGLLENYIATIPDGLLYKYEDFVSGEYGLLEKHLGMPITGKAEVHKTLARVKRTGAYGDWRNWFTAEDVEDCKPLLTPWLQKFGYDAEDWALNPEPLIERKHCSEYVMRLIEERRANPPRKASILRAEPAIVSGWAFGSDPHQPVSIVLLVNGNEVARAVADRPLGALQEQGVHPPGKCGFLFEFEPGKYLTVGDEVTIKPTGADVAFRATSSIVGEATAGTG